MIRLTPQVELDVSCPNCGVPMHLGDFSISGVHHTVACNCQRCDGTFEQEMPVNTGLFYPILLDSKSGERRDKFTFDNWFTRGLVSAYHQRVDEPLPFKVEELRPFSRKKIAILSALDGCYGHCLYQLWNAQYYLNQEDIDLIILVQEPLRWMVPKGAAQIWTVGLPFSKATGWNRWLAERIRQEVAGLDNVHLCRAFVQADSSDFDIERFTEIAPFPLEAWDTRLTKPTITFIWRTDRFWRRFVPRLVDNRFTRKVAGEPLNELQHRIQQRWIIALANKLRGSIPNLDFAVAGMDNQRFGFPSWIKDLRHPKHTDETARAMCARYGQSHLVIGCNGSSLLLPSAMAGSCINLVPGDQWAVSAGTFGFRITEMGDTHFRYVMLPSESTIKRVASVAVSILRDRSLIQLHTAKPWRDHEVQQDPFAWGRFREQALTNGRHLQAEDGLITMARKLPRQDAADIG